jgi:hypothetical protein
MSACPKCGQNDQVQKVTAIVTSGTTSGTLTYYDNAYYQTSTGLARRLLIPGEGPSVTRPGSCSMLLLILLLAAFGFIVYVILGMTVLYNVIHSLGEGFSFVISAPRQLSLTDSAVVPAYWWAILALLNHRTYCHRLAHMVS